MKKVNETDFKRSECSLHSKGECGFFIHTIFKILDFCYDLGI